MWEYHFTRVGGVRKDETPTHSSIWGTLNDLSIFLLNDVIELRRRLKRRI